jgi:hypothetical protein
METTDNVIHIRHEADWSSNALVSWIDPQTRPHVVSIEAPLLWSDSPDRIDLCSPPYTMPASVAVRSVRLATRGRARWEHDQVLSRPVPGRALVPPTDRQADTKRHDPTDAWLFDADLATESCSRPGVPRRRIPLGWVENVAIAMCSNAYAGKVNRETSVLIDIGAPHRDPCNCGNPLFHARGCPQSGTFPRIGRLAINLKRVEGFIETMRAARTSVERIFVP